jgi:hypothetical protein
LKRVFEIDVLTCPWCGRKRELIALLTDGKVVRRITSGTSVRLEASAVVERAPHRLSRMPDGLLDLFSSDEILDLLAYVLAGGEREDERFR